MNAVKPAVLSCRSRRCSRWSTRSSSVSTWPNIIVAVVFIPRPWATSITWSHSAVEPLRDADDVPHAVRQDLGTAARDRVQAGSHEAPERLFHREPRHAADVVDLGRREAVDPDRIGLLDPAEEPLVELDAEVGMEPSLEQDLVPAERQRLLDLRGELLLREEVSLLRGQVAIEGAEGALGGADVRVVDVPVDDVRDDPLGVLALAHGVGQHSELQEITVAQEDDPLRPRADAPPPGPCVRSSQEWPWNLRSGTRRIRPCAWARR